jgi:hypothetical protein
MAGKMQECFNNEAFCKKRAAAATDATASAVFAQCARCWRELADCWRELTSKSAQRVDKLRQNSNDGGRPHWRHPQLSTFGCRKAQMSWALNQRPNRPGRHTGYPAPPHQQRQIISALLPPSSSQG